MLRLRHRDGPFEEHAEGPDAASTAGRRPSLAAPKIRAAAVNAWRFGNSSRSAGAFFADIRVSHTSHYLPVGPPRPACGILLAR
jgi:hypothetical protein